MELSELQAKIADLEQQIAELPAGSVTKKTINGNVYFYHRWTEDKKRREKYIPAEEVDSFRKQIERRKALEKELKVLQKQLPRNPYLLSLHIPLQRISALARRCVPFLPLSAGIASVSASGSCMTIFTVSRRIKCSFSMVCAGREKQPWSVRSS